MRRIKIVDLPGMHAKATLWANRAVEFDVREGTVVAFRNVKVDGEGEGGYLMLISC